MAILSKGNTFADNEQVTTTKLHNLVDNASFVAGSSGTTDDSTLEVNGSGRLQVKTVQTGNIANNAITTSKLASPLAPGVVISGNSSGDAVSITQAGSGDALRVTQTGTGNALVVEDSANPDSTPFVVNAAGKMLVGTTSSRNNFNNSSFSALAQIEGVSGSASLSIVNNDANDTSQPYIVLAKSAGSTIGSNTLVSNNESLGEVTFQGNDGNEFVSGAVIQCMVDGTPGANDMPGRLVFGTTADGGSSPTERMRIDNAGNVGIGTTAPTAKLNVVDNSASDAVRITQYGAGNALVVEDSANPDATPFVVSPVGDVGIGTSSPGYKLDVNGKTNLNSSVRTLPLNVGSLTRAQLQSEYNLDNTAASALTWNYSNGGGELNLFINRGAGVVGGFTIWDFPNTSGNPANIFTVQGSGNVGIGSSSPDAGLTVLKSVTISSQANVAARIGSGGNSDLLLGSTNGDTPFIASRGAYPLVLSTNASERVRVDSSGNVGIGTTTPSEKLEVNGTVKATEFDGTVGTDGVETTSIQNDAVTQAKIADAAVGTAQLIDANITAAKLNGAQTGTAPIYGIRAWVNFDGTVNADKTGTYSRTASSTTATISITSHGLKSGQYVYLDFASGTADGVYQVTVTNDNSFTITTSETTAESSIVVTLKLVTVTASANINYVGRASTSDGRYLVGFSEDMPSANYAFFGSAEDSSDADLSDLLVGCPFNGTKTAKSIYITVANSGNVGVDSPGVSVAFIG